MSGEQDTRQGQEQTVTDEEIQDILSEGEAGIADLMRVYEPAEQSYFHAVQHTTTTVTYSADTTRR